MTHKDLFSDDKRSAKLGVLAAIGYNVLSSRSPKATLTQIKNVLKPQTIGLEPWKDSNNNGAFKFYIINEALFPTMLLSEAYEDLCLKVGKSPPDPSYKATYRMNNPYYFPNYLEKLDGILSEMQNEEHIKIITKTNFRGEVTNRVYELTPRGLDVLVEFCPDKEEKLRCKLGFQKQGEAPASDSTADLNHVGRQSLSNPTGRIR